MFVPGKFFQSNVIIVIVACTYRNEAAHSAKLHHGASGLMLKYKSNQEELARDKHTSGLYFKTITIIIMTIVSDATIWSVIYIRN